MMALTVIEGCMHGFRIYRNIGFSTILNPRTLMARIARRWGGRGITARRWYSDPPNPKRKTLNARTQPKTPCITGASTDDACRLYECLGSQYFKVLGIGV